jgi:predicted phosphate transport protein (TIGR00153 family)
MRFWMPPFTTGKEKDILEYLLKVMNSVFLTVQSLDKAVKGFVEGDWENVEKEIKKCSEYETQADNERRVLERMLYSEGFLPFSRGDYFNLAEAIDDIADQAEKASFWMSFKRIKIPSDIKSDLIKLSEKTLSSVNLMKNLIHHIGPESKNIIQATQRVDQERDEVREIATNLGKKIFGGNLKDSQMLWELVYRIMSVADRAEEASDRIVRITMSLIE